MKHLPHLLCISIIFVFVHVTSAYSSVPNPLHQDDKLPTGTWVAEINDIGNIVIRCNKDNQTCDLFWVFQEIKLKASVKDNILELSEPNGKGVSLRIKMLENVPDRFIIDNVLVDDASNNFSTLRFKKSKKWFTDYSEYRSHGDYTIYHDGGRLMPLPDSFPAWFMNPTLMLFMENSQSRNGSIAVDVILQHHSLTPESLHKAITYYSNDDSRSYRYPIIAKHANLSRPSLALLFDENVTPRNAPIIWNAVSEQANAPEYYRSEYYQRIKKANRRLLNEFLEDKNAPPDLLDWYVRSYIDDKLSFHNSLFLNKNLSTETIDFILTSKNYYNYRNTDSEALAEIVVLPNIAEQSRQKIIKIAMPNVLAKDFLMVSKIIIAITRNVEINSPGITSLIKTMAVSEHSEMRKLAAKDPRLPPDLIEYFINTEEIDVRASVIQNPALTLDQLEILANDLYRKVREDALYVIKNRFPASYENIFQSLPPKSKLNPAIFVVAELGTALKKNDRPGVSRTISLIHKFNLKPGYVFSVGPAIASGNQELVDLVMSELPGNMNAERFFKDENYSDDWLQLFLDNDWLKGLDSFDVMHSAVINLHLASYIKLALHGFEMNPTNKRTNRTLIKTLIIKSGILFYGAVSIPYIMQVTALLMLFFFPKRSNTISYGLTASSYILLLPALFVLLFGSCFFGCSDVDGIWALLILAVMLTIAIIFKGKVNKKNLVPL